MADKINPAFLNKPDKYLLANATSRADPPTLRDYTRKVAATQTNPIDTKDKAEARRRTAVTEELNTRAAANIANSNNPVGALLAPNGWGDAGETFSDAIEHQGGWGLAPDTRMLLGADDAPRGQPGVTGYLRDVKRPVQNFVANAAELAFRGYQAGMGGVETAALGLDKGLDNAGVSTITDPIAGYSHSFQPGHGALSLMEALPDGGLHMTGLPFVEGRGAPAEAPMVPKLPSDGVRKVADWWRDRRGDVSRTPVIDDATGHIVGDVPSEAQAPAVNGKRRPFVMKSEADGVTEPPKAPESVDYTPEPPAPAMTPESYADAAAEKGLDFLNSPEAVDYYTKNAPDIKAELDRRLGESPAPTMSSAQGAEDILSNPEKGFVNPVTVRDTEGLKALMAERGVTPESISERYPPMSTSDGGTTPPGPPGEPPTGGNGNPPPGGYEPGYVPGRDDRFVGSVNVPNLNMTPEASTALRAVGEETPIGRKVQGWDETNAGAEGLNRTPEEIANDPSFANLPEKLREGQMKVREGWQSVIDTAKTHGVGTDEYNKALLDAITTATSHSENVGQTARGLNVLRQPLEGDTPLSARDMKAINDFASDPTNADRLNDLIQQHLDDPEAMRRLARDIRKPKFSDWIASGAYNMMLSNPQTLSRNIFGNAINLYGDIATHGWASLIGAARTGKASAADRAMGRSVMGRLYGSYVGTLQGLKNFPTAYREASPLDIAYREGGGSPFHGKAAMVLEAATRTMAASDEVARMMAKMSDLYGQATKKAINEGETGWGKGSGVWDRVNELVANPTDHMLDQADDYARLMRFQDEPGFVAAAAEGMLKIKPSDTPPVAAMKMATRLTVLPFIRTPSSILRTAARNSPLGILSSKNWKDFKAGGELRDKAIARVAAGTALTGVAATMANNGDITGMGPEDYKKQAELQASGWRPNSVKVGDKYVSYDNLGPVSIILSSTATAVERHKAGEVAGDAYGKKMADVSLGVADAMLNNGWMETLANTFGALTGPATQRESALGNAAANTASSLTVPALLRSVNQSYIDPMSRETKGDGSLGDRVANRIKAGIPGLSQTLPERHDVYGDPIEKKVAGGPLKILNPVSYSDVKSDPQEQELSRLSNDPSKPLVPPVQTSFRVPGTGQNLKLSGEDYQKYQEIVGQYVKMNLSDAMSSPEWKDVPDDNKRAIVKNMLKEGRKTARDLILSQASEDTGTPPASGNPLIPSAKADTPDLPANGEAFVGIPTSIRRTVKGNEAVGGKAHSDHLNGDAVDFTPPPGMTMGELENQAREFFPGMYVLNEGDHVHVRIPGLNGPLFGKKGVQ